MVENNQEEPPTYEEAIGMISYLTDIAANG
jgi:hypothetical protein